MPNPEPSCGNPDHENDVERSAASRPAWQSSTTRRSAGANPSHHGRDARTYAPGSSLAWQRPFAQRTPAQGWALVPFRPAAVTQGHRALGGMTERFQARHGLYKYAAMPVFVLWTSAMLATLMRR